MASARTDSAPAALPEPWPARHPSGDRPAVWAAGLAKSVEIRVGKASDALPKLAAEKAGPFDLFFIDADKASIPEYFDWAVKLARLA